MYLTRLEIMLQAACFYEHIHTQSHIVLLVFMIEFSTKNLVVKAPESNLISILKVTELFWRPAFAVLVLYKRA